MMWSDTSDYPVSVPPFGCGVLDGNVGAYVNLWKRVCFLVVVLLTAGCSCQPRVPWSGPVVCV